VLAGVVELAGGLELLGGHDGGSAAAKPARTRDGQSGAVAERPELARALDHLRPGDTLVVWKLELGQRAEPAVLRRWSATTITTWCAGRAAPSPTSIAPSAPHPA
jgi:hypothetical protein